MRTDEIQAYRAKAKEAYEKDIAEAKAKLKARMEAADWLERDMKEKAGEKVNDADDIATQTARAALPGLAHYTEFDKQAVERVIVSMGNRPVSSSTLSKILIRLADAGILEYVKRGAGRRPTTYRVKQAATPDT